MLQETENLYHFDVEKASIFQLDIAASLEGKQTFSEHVASTPILVETILFFDNVYIVIEK